MPNPNEPVSGIRAWPRWRLALFGGAVVVIALLLVLRGRAPAGAEAATFAARRGPLDITVLEGGSVQALESQEIKCEVRVGYQGTKILKIVEEGYEVTEEDVRTNKVLVELDSSDLQKQIVQQDIQYASAAASLTDAQQNYEIQLNQNQSDLKAAEQKVRFARMDFDKLLGDQVTQAIIDQLGLDAQLAVEQTNALERSAAVAASVPRDRASRPPPGAVPSGVVVKVEKPPGNPEPATNASAMPVAAPNPPTSAPVKMVVAPGSPPDALVTMVAAAGPPPSTPGTVPSDPPKPDPIPAAPSVIIDFSKYANIDVLGDGEAKQKLRKFEDDLQVAKKEEGQAQANYEGTKRLFDKGFETKLKLEGDDIAAGNSRLKVQTAETARGLYLRYDFAKTGEESLSKYSEAVRELARARKAAVSKLAQAEARLKSAQAQYNIQARQRKELYDQQDKCVITAKKQGLVVYGGPRDDMMFYGGEERIREGATVRERQSIITIPDMTKMCVNMKIHESYIKKVKKGQKAKITLDAFADKVLAGEVTKVGVLPDSQNRWMNPDMIVYLTTVAVEGTHDWLKPGMKGKVEILVDRLADVVYVPVQAISPSDGKQFCHVANGRKPERRQVEIGQFNDEFIEIKKGLKAGELVMLRPAETPSPEKTGAEKPGEPKGAQPAEKTTPRPTATPASAPVTLPRQG
jgi:hypothetical protein